MIPEEMYLNNKTGASGSAAFRGFLPAICRKWSGVDMGKRLKEIAQIGIYRFAASKDEKTILGKIAGRSVVSFDVFDTSVKRDVLLPTDVFTLIEKKLVRESKDTYKNFANLRVEAEKTARAINPSREVTLSEIYGQMPFEKAQLRRMLQLECETELGVSAPNLPVKRVYDACVQLGKKILFITDMYLPAETIRKILKKNGYGQGTLYVSCEKGFTKRSGKLFEYVRDTEKLSVKDWAHIGDAIYSDNLVPKRLGIQTILIERNPKYSPYVYKKLYQKNKMYRQLNHFIDSRITRYTDPYEQIGYAVLGPLLYGFSCWLERMIPKDKTIVFLAREGALLQKAFEIVSDRPSLFLHISRRAANLSKLAVVQNSDEVSQCNIPTIRRTPTVRELANHFGISNKDIKDLFKNSGMNEATVISSPKIEERVLNVIWPVAKEKGIQQYALLQKYFEQLGLSNNCALVDVGWHGTIQTLLSSSHYSIHGNEVNWCGYYLGAMEKVRHSSYYNDIKRGFLFEKGKRKSIEDGIRYSIPFFELLFLSTSGSTVGYQMTTTGVVSPILGEPENNCKINRIIESVQNSGLQFVKDISLHEYFFLDAEVSSGNYLSLAEVPSCKTLALFSDFNTEDGYLHKLTSEYSAGYYLFHPKQFLADFKQMPGKAWFLKSILKIPLPYIPIISLAKKAFSKE